MSETNNKTGLYVGINHGHVVNRPKVQAWKKRPVLRKGLTSKRAVAVRSVIREIAGFSPLEKTMIEMIRTGVASKEKKASKRARAKLGTHRRAMHKKEELVNLIALQRRG